MKKLTFEEKVLGFYKTLNTPLHISPKIEIIHPYKIPEVQKYMKEFYTKFFSDNRTRVFVFGINPGRFGSATTGVSFTDPIALEQFCGIQNTLAKRRELSSEFVYKFIEHWGGTRMFYKDFFLTAVSPIGFTCNGINYNYYDDPSFFSHLKPFLVDTIKKQIVFGATRKVAIVFGTGKNLKNFTELNGEYQFFKKIYAVEHPRFIMQYQRKNISKYLKKYHDVFSQALLWK